MCLVLAITLCLAYGIGQWNSHGTQYKSILFCIGIALNLFSSNRNVYLFFTGFDICILSKDNVKVTNLKQVNFNM